jgi:phage baseplate assembly protein gpV
MFGPSAMLDINGSFHASTADVLRFADGAVFSTRLSENTTLTVAAPSAFGFLHVNPASIAIEGSDLEVTEGETLSIVGGTLDIKGGTLRAPSGQVTLASVASTGDAMIDLSNPLRGVNVDSFERRGKITLSQDARLDTSGNRSGAINIRGGRLHSDGVLLLAVTLGNDDSNGIGIDIDIAEDIVLGSGTDITQYHSAQTLPSIYQ